MNETRYFIINHKDAFAKCNMNNEHWDGALRQADIQSTGRIRTPVFDGGEQGNAWKRVLADVTIPDKGRIVWRVHSADNERALGMGEAFIIENAYDFLLPGVTGRYALLEAEFNGGVEIRSIQLFSAWESFLDYLPEIYQDNGFAERFLRLFVAQYLEMEERINAMPGMLDPVCAPERMLRWLAGIAGIANVNLWRTEGLRELLVSGIYKRRGQFSVFADYIEYFTGHRPYIAEHFRFVTGYPENDRLYRGADVSVFLPPEAMGLDMDALNVVIADFLPADVMWRVILLHPNAVVSGYTYVGINTRVGEYEGTVVGKSRIGFSVVGGTV